MKTIWKYPLKTTGRQAISMPRGAKILTVQMQGTVPTLWVLVESRSDLESRAILTFGTGHEISLSGNYIGTYQTGSFVFHVFEEV